MKTNHIIAISVAGMLLGLACLFFSIWFFSWLAAQDDHLGWRQTPCGLSGLIGAMVGIGLMCWSGATIASTLDKKDNGR